jgi:hypothetical protein
MADATFKAAVRASMGLVVSEKTLIDLSNQRANEVGDTDTPAALTIDEDVLTEAIRLAAAQIEPYHGTQTGSSDVLAIKHCSEMALNDICVKHGMPPGDRGLQKRADLSRSLEEARDNRVAENSVITFRQKRTNYPTSPSGHEPLGTADGT